MKYYQHLRAKNSNMGNPRRLFVVYNEEGSIVEVIDEGYAGKPRKFRDTNEYKELPSIEIEGREYKNFKAMG